MKKITPLIFLALLSLGAYAQEDVVFESFEAKKYSENLKRFAGNNKNTKKPIASFSFSNMGYNDKSSMRISIKPQPQSGPIKLSVKNFALSKNKTYRVSFLIKSLTGQGKISVSLFNYIKKSPSSKEHKYTYTAFSQKTFKFEGDGTWQRKAIHVEAKKKNTKGETINLNKMSLSLNLNNLKRGIYLIDNIKVTEIEPDEK